MSSATIQADLRKKLGSREARRLRAEGRIPASLQGGEGDHLDIHLDSRLFWEARRHHVHLFDIEVDGRSEPATVRELQWDPLGDELNHIEFMRVVRGVKTQVEVALEFTGQPAGGVLAHLVDVLEVRCLPSQIPDSIEVKVDDLEAGHPMTAGDVKLPEGFELVTPAETPVATLSSAGGLEEGSAAEEGEDVAPTEETPEPPTEGD